MLDCRRASRLLGSLIHSADRYAESSVSFFSPFSFDDYYYYYYYFFFFTVLCVHSVVFFLFKCGAATSALHLSLVNILLINLLSLFAECNNSSKKINSNRHLQYCNFAQPFSSNSPLYYYCIYCCALQRFARVTEE